MPLALAGFTLCCLVEQCPYLVEFSALIESLVSSSMYTKFSEALSIKYPEELNTAYPAAGSGNEFEAETSMSCSSEGALRAMV